MKKRISSIVTAIITSSLLVSCQSPSNEDQDSSTGAANKPSSINEVVFFGDSLTDAGTYGHRYTTDPGLTWAQHVADRFGQSHESNEHVANVDDVYKGIPGLPGPGGLNYAQASSRVSLPYSTVSDNPQGTPISSTIQLDKFLDQHQEFKPGQLATLYIGTNDIVINYDPDHHQETAEKLRSDIMPDDSSLAEDRQLVEDAAESAADLVGNMLENGAEDVLVFKLFDLSDAPWFQTTAARNYMGQLTEAYNERLVESLPKSENVHTFDTGRFTSDLLDNSERYGFSHGANEDACTDPEPGYCNEPGWKTPTADKDFVFAGKVHMSSESNRLLAESVISAIENDFEVDLVN